jgi:outer membrane protein assembly factor BamB
MDAVAPAPSVPVSQPGFFRRWRVPMFALGIPAALLGVLIATQHYEVLPEAMFPIMMAFQVTALVGLLTLIVWFVFFSPLRWRTRLVVILLIAGGLGAWISQIKRVEFYGMMGMRIYYRGQKDPRDDVQQYLATTKPTEEKLSAGDVVATPADFPRYRGEKGDGAVAYINLDAWKDKGFKLLQQQPIGGGYAGFIVFGKVMATLEQRGKDEAIVCYDRDTAKEIWIFRYPAFFEQSEPMGGSGSRATPAVQDGMVYSLGATGELVCLNATNGDLQWKRNILKDNGAANIQWGVSASPLVLGNKVIVQAGINPKNNVGKAVAAYDRRTGAQIWANGTHPAGYASPTLATLDGMEQVVIFDGDGLAGLDPADGKELWRHPWKTQFDMNNIQPLFFPGDRIFVSSEQANGCAMLKVSKAEDGWKVETLWKTRSLAARFANPVARGELIFGLSNNRLTCVDAKDGKRLWKDGDFGSGQLLAAGETLLVQGETGDIAAVAAEANGYRELARLHVFEGKVWNTPAFSRGRLYLRTHEQMAIVEVP